VVWGAENSISASPLAMDMGEGRVCNTIYGREGNSGCSQNLPIRPVSIVLEGTDFMAKGYVDFITERLDVDFGGS